MRRKSKGGRRVSRLVLGFSPPLNRQGSRGNERGGRGGYTHKTRLVSNRIFTSHQPHRSAHDDIKEKRRLHVKDRQKQTFQRHTHTETERHIERQRQTDTYKDRHRQRKCEQQEGPFRIFRVKRTFLPLQIAQVRVKWTFLPLQIAQFRVNL